MCGVVYLIYTAHDVTHSVGTKEHIILLPTPIGCKTTQIKHKIKILNYENWHRRTIKETINIHTTQVM